MTESTIVLPWFFRGPPQSSQGGYPAGVAAGLLDSAAIVTLHKPPPIERPLCVSPEVLSADSELLRLAFTDSA